MSAPMLWLLLLLLCGGFCAVECKAHEACTSLLPVAQAACPLADNPSAALEALLESRLAGQLDARVALVKVIAKNADKFLRERTRKRDQVARLVLGFPHSLTAPAQAKGKTLFLHFSGPTGVGKSLAGRLVAEALFQGHCGAVTYNLNEHRSVKSWRRQALLDDILQKFQSQLSRCPRSIFVLDEIQSCPPWLVDGIIAFFQPHGIQAPALSRTNAYPIVVLISDLGTQELRAGLTRAEAVSVLTESCKERFGGTTESILLDNMVPFLPLSSDELAEVATMELNVLQAQLRIEFGQSWSGKLTWQRGVAMRLARACFAEGSCYAQGGRGIESKVHHEIAREVESLVALCISATGGCSDNVDVRLERRHGHHHSEIKTAHGERGAPLGVLEVEVLEVDGLFIVLDSVYGSTEFEGYLPTDNLEEKGKGTEL